ncbi:unnamed protein product, partial [Lathyrus sativus]
GDAEAASTCVPCVA